MRTRRLAVYTITVDFLSGERAVVPCSDYTFSEAEGLRLRIDYETMESVEFDMSFTKGSIKKWKALPYDPKMKQKQIFLHQKSLGTNSTRKKGPTKGFKEIKEFKDSKRPT